MSASLGLGFSASSATADRIMPGWQYPHWGTSSSAQACWTGWLPSGESPSMVTTFCAADSVSTGMTQERTARPSTSTVQAPQSPMPQLYLVPVRPSCSRSTHSRGVVPSTSSSTGSPLIVRVAIEKGSGM